MRPATKPLGSTLQPGQSQLQSSFAAICGAGALSSTRSLTFRHGYVVELTASTGVQQEMMDPAISKPHEELARWQKKHRPAAAE